MSASGVREKLNTIDGVIEIAKTYLSLDVDAKTAKKCLRYRNGNVDAVNCGWCNSAYAVSAGPIVWLKNRLHDCGFLSCDPPEEHDDVPIFFRKIRNKTVAVFSEIARSKMFRTPLVVFPIDLTASRVSVKPYC